MVFFVDGESSFPWIFRVRGEALAKFSPMIEGKFCWRVLRPYKPYFTWNRSSLSVPIIPKIGQNVMSISLPTKLMENSDISTIIKNDRTKEGKRTFYTYGIPQFISSLPIRSLRRTRGLPNTHTGLLQPKPISHRGCGLPPQVAVLLVAALTATGVFAYFQVSGRIIPACAAACRWAG
jgi:hypothetical protein